MGRDWKIRPVKMPDAMWTELGELADELNSDRSTLIRDMIRRRLARRRGRTGDTPTPDDHGDA